MCVRRWEILINIRDSIAGVFLEDIVAHLANPSISSVIVNLVPFLFQPARRVLPAVGITVIPEVGGCIRIILVQVAHMQGKETVDLRAKPNPTQP